GSLTVLCGVHCRRSRYGRLFPWCVGCRGSGEALRGLLLLFLVLNLLFLPDARLTLLLLLQLGPGVEELPSKQNSHRKNDGEKEVLLIFLVVQHRCLDN